MAATDAVKTEGNSGTTTLTFTVTRSGDTSAAGGVDYAVAGSGANPADAADFAGAALPSGHLTFAAGETTKLVTIAVAGDTTVEPDEGLTLTLTNASGATITTATAQGLIKNDDLPTTTLAVAATDAFKTEGNSGTTALTFTVTRGGDTSAAASVDYAVAGSGANPANAADFAGAALPSGHLTFAAGETTKLVTIAVAGDTSVEQDEGLTLTLTNASGATITTATAQGVIKNDDGTVTETFNANGQLTQRTISYPDNTLEVFTYLITGQTYSSEHTVYSTGAGGWKVISLTRTHPDGTLDYQQINNPDGTSLTDQYSPAGIIVQRIATHTDSTLDVYHYSSTGQLLDHTIYDASWNVLSHVPVIPPTIGVEATNAALQEGNSGTTALTFTVTRSGDSSTAASVDYAVAGSGANPADAADFAGAALPSGHLTFAAGETTKLVTIAVAGDTTVEPDEAFTLTLTNASGLAITTATAQGLIKNDDIPAETSITLVGLALDRSVDLFI